MKQLSSYCGRTVVQYSASRAASQGVANDSAPPQGLARALSLDAATPEVDGGQSRATPRQVDEQKICDTRPNVDRAGDPKAFEVRILSVRSEIEERLTLDHQTIEVFD